MDAEAVVEGQWRGENAASERRPGDCHEQKEQTRPLQHAALIPRRRAASNGRFDPKPRRSCALAIVAQPGLYA
jgi:hypothetical protein